MQNMKLGCLQLLMEIYSDLSWRLFFVTNELSGWDQLKVCSELRVLFQNMIGAKAENDRDGDIAVM